MAFSLILRYAIFILHNFIEFYFAYCILESNTGLNRLNRNDNSSGGKKKNKFISVHDTYRVVLNFFEYLQQYMANGI